MGPPVHARPLGIADAAHVSAHVRGCGECHPSELGMPARAAELSLNLLVKIDSKLPSKDRGCDHHIGELLTDIVRGTVAQALTHRPPQTLDTVAGTFDQTQSGICQGVLAIPLSQPICERDDPWVRGNHRQIRIGVSTQNEKAVTDDLCPESALSASPFAQLAVDNASCPVQQKSSAQLMWRHMDLELDTEPTRNDVRIARQHQLDPSACQ